MKPIPYFSAGVIKAAMLAVGLFVSGAASAQWVVVSSTSPELKAGTLIDSGQAVDVKAGMSIKLLARDGKAITLTGPHAGAITGEAPKGGDAAAFQAVTSFLKGHQQATTVLGSMRGTNARPPSYELINADSSGQACIMSKDVNFWRKDVAETEVVSVLDDAGEEIVSATWEAGEPMLTLEAGAFQDGRAYELARDSKSTEVHVHVLKKTLKGVMEKTAWLASNGCRAQAKTLLEGI